MPRCFCASLQCLRARPKQRPRHLAKASAGGESSLSSCATGVFPSGPHSWHKAVPSSLSSSFTTAAVLAAASFCSEFALSRFSAREVRMSSLHVSKQVRISWLKGSKRAASARSSLAPSRSLAVPGSPLARPRRYSNFARAAVVSPSGNFRAQRKPQPAALMALAKSPRFRSIMVRLLRTGSNASAVCCRCSSVKSSCCLAVKSRVCMAPKAQCSARR
mmetsp:Transcript_71914/g.119140  ORF Transcript_71914/g.119140 Transcript_71914/m.119140 type:complete len:218 (+) Transcript_71914:261-914(+)